MTSPLSIARRALILSSISLGAAPSVRAADPSGALARILTSGVVRVGVWLRNPPWAGLDPQGLPDGFEIALVRRFAQFLDVRIEFRSVEAEDRLPSLERGEVDVLAASFPILALTAARVALARPHSRVNGVIACRSTEPLLSYAAFGGRRIAVPAGTFLAETVALAVPAGTEMIFLANQEDCLRAVANRDADGAAVQDWVLRRHLLSERESPLRQALIVREWRISMAVRLGELDLLHYINNFLRVEAASGRLEQLRRFYFQGTTADIGQTP